MKNKKIMTIDKSYSENIISDGYFIVTNNPYQFNNRK